MISENILDKVIESHTEKMKADLNMQELVNFLLQDLSHREREVIKARYGLEKEQKETLDSIGKKLSITRERVRQIEKVALEKAKQTSGIKEKLDDLIQLITKNLSTHGNLRLESSLVKDILDNNENREADGNCLAFILKIFMSEHVEPLDIIYTDRAWKLKNKKHGHFAELVEHAKNILAKGGQPLHLDEIIGEIKSSIDEEKIRELEKNFDDLHKVFYSCLEISKHFKKNIFDKWGLINWRSVNPKRMRDKIYLILLKYKKPLHYKIITDHINEEDFDKKKAHPPTIHNELILDDRFVLIGRGIYALIEWGYKPGAISEVIVDILKNAGEPLNKDAIIAKVLQRRVVKEGSINLALLNKDLFTKIEDNRYTLKNSG